MVLPPCCPVTGNPQPGSDLVIEYTATEWFLEVISLHAYVESYVGGRGEVRSMEGMIQQIATDAAECIGVEVTVAARLKLIPEQEMSVICVGVPA